MVNQDQQQDIEKQQEPSKSEVAAMIADTLGETEEGPRKNIENIVRAVGRTHAKELLSMTLQTEENGGLMLPDGSRRRTPGGVFFYFAYSVGKTKNGKPLQRPWNNTKPAKKPDAEVSTSSNTTSQPAKPQNRIVEPQKPIVFSWEDRIPVANEASQEKGSASAVKITIIGRPGKILDKDQFIVTVIESTKIPSLPKGLPAPTNAATKYAVYIAKKQWNKVKDAIQDPEDVLIIEGFPKADAEVSAIAVFTTNVTTKKLQQAMREKQQTAVN